MAKFKIDQDYTIEVTEDGFTLNDKHSYKTLKLVLQQYISLALDDNNFERVFKNAETVETKIKRQFK